MEREREKKANMKNDSVIPYILFSFSRQFITCMKRRHTWKKMKHSSNI